MLSCLNRYVKTAMCALRLTARFTISMMFPNLTKSSNTASMSLSIVLLSRKALIQGLPIRWKQHLRSATGSQRLISCPTGMRQRRIFPLKKRPQTGESSLRTVWRSCFFLRILPVMSAVSALKKCHRECSRSTVRSVPARTAPALVIRKKSIRCLLFRMIRCL